MHINKFWYFGDFFAVPLLILTFVAAAYRSEGLAAAPGFLVSAPFGVLVWTFAEYWIHRWAYHHAPGLSPLHDLHHEDPKAFIGAPSFMAIPILIAVSLIPLYPFGIVVVCGFGSGLSLGYLFYLFVHHAVHHFDIRPGHWLYRLRLHHMVHHYRDETNFGIVTSFWDRAFGTARAPGGRVAHS